MRSNSLAFRLIASSAVWSIVILAITGFVLTSLFRASVEKSFDERLEDNLNALLASIEFNENGQLFETVVLADPKYQRPFQGWYWQVRSVAPGTESRLTSFASLLEKSLDIPEHPVRDVQTGSPVQFYLTGPYGKSLRVIEGKFTLPGSTELLSFAVSGNADALEAEIQNFRQTVIIALSVLAIGLLLATFLQVKFGLIPLRKLQQGLVSVRTGREERLEETYPDEIQPVAAELNALLKANQDIVERARTQVGNLAHALKTPLSVITNEATNSDGRFSVKVREQAEVMRDQIGLYLDRAQRAARAHALGSLTEVRPVLDALVRTLQRINHEKAITVDLRCSPAMLFRGERQDFEEMIGNLLDNAFKWAETWVRIEVYFEKAAGTSLDGGRLLIVVEDDGPGLPPDRRREALERGRRLDETKPGSGLGLSIVSETAAMYSGAIDLNSSDRGGLRIQLSFPSMGAQTTSATDQ